MRKVIILEALRCSTKLLNLVVGRKFKNSILKTQTKVPPFSQCIYIAPQTDKRRIMVEQ